MRTESEIRKALEINTKDLNYCKIAADDIPYGTSEYQDLEREYEKIEAVVRLLKWILEIE